MIIFSSLAFWLPGSVAKSLRRNKAVKGQTWGSCWAQTHSSR